MKGRKGKEKKDRKGKNLSESFSKPSIETISRESLWNDWTGLDRTKKRKRKLLQKVVKKF